MRKSLHCFISAVSLGGESFAHAYGAANRLVTVGGVAYTWDANPLRCEDFMGISYLEGQILAEYEVGAWAYVAPDALGSVRQLVNAAGQVTLAQSYDPFGVLISQSTNLPISQSPHLLATYSLLTFF